MYHMASGLIQQLDKGNLLKFPSTGNLFSCLAQECITYSGSADLIN